jgi:hypothetical protein
MANLVELQAGEGLPTRRHALIISSPKAPPAGAPVMDRHTSQIFYATDSADDIAQVAKRALAWADEREIANVYLRRQR